VAGNREAGHGAVFTILLPIPADQPERVS